MCFICDVTPATAGNPEHCCHPLTEPALPSAAKTGGGYRAREAEVMVGPSMGDIGTAIASNNAQPLLMPTTGDARIDGLLWGWQWNTTDLTYRFPQSANEFAPQFFGGPGYQNIIDFTPFSNFQAQQIVNLGLNNLSVFSQLKFTPDTSFGGGNLRFAQASAIQYEAGSVDGSLHIPGGRGSAEATPPDPFLFRGSSMGDNWFTLGVYENPVLGSFQYAAGLLHEVGHALGLKHGHATQTRADGTANPEMLPTLPEEVDSQEFSVMTYRSHVGVDVGGGASGIEEYPWTYMQLDYLALQHMYGSNHGAGSNDGDTTYQFDPLTGEMTITDENGSADFSQGFGASYNAKILLTVWDGDGTDTYDFSNYSQGQSVDLAPGGWSTFSDDQLSNLSLGKAGPANFARGNIANALLYLDDERSLIENVLTGTGNDVVSGNQADNRFETGDGNDRLTGLAGNDTLVSGSGNDQLFAGIGDDQLIGGLGNDLMRGGDGDDRFIAGDGADIGFGGEGRDFMIGQGGNDRLIGEAGDDFVIGQDGDDSLNGGDGTDRMFGDAGNDELQGGAGLDLLRGGDGNDRLFGGTGVGVLLGDAGNDALFGGGVRDRLFGGIQSDTLVGGADLDVLFGGVGNDILIGGLGPDFLNGEGGADQFRIGQNDSGLTPATRDTIRDFDRAEGDRINLATIDGNIALPGIQPLSFIGSDVGFSGAGQVRWLSVGFLEVSIDADFAPEIRILVQNVSEIGRPDLIL
ncbi:MAG: M10 family metallopeptidase [Pseudomonadota bacterium]